MLFRNTITGCVIDVSEGFKGDCWEPVKVPGKTPIVKAEAKAEEKTEAKPERKTTGTKPRKGSKK